MNRLDISFDENPWQTYRMTLQLGDTVSAAELLTMLEGYSDDVLEDALQDMEEGCINLSIEHFSRGFGTGEAALRLRREAELVKKGITPGDLEENDPLRVYLEEVASTPAFGNEDQLAVDAAKGDENAMLQLTNLGLARVIELAREHTGFGVLLLDLIQEGSLGLWQAIRNYRCGTYAAHRDKWIRLYMAKAITLQARSRGVGQKLRTALEDYRAVDERLLGDLGRNPTLEEIAEELHISAQEAEAVRRMLDNARLMQKAHPKQEEEEPDQDDEQAVENTGLFQMRARIAELLSALAPEDQQLLTLRFGLEGGLPLSTEDTARKLGLTPDEVTAREAAALSVLRTK